MKHLLAAAALTAAALAAPAAAGPPAGSAIGTDLLYTVTASYPGDPARLSATCTFRPDRWTADYGPTYIDGVAATAGPGNYTTLRCRIYTSGSLAGDVSAWESGSVATITGAREGTVGYRPNVLVCVDAFTQYVVDVSYSVSRCVRP